MLPESDFSQSFLISFSVKCIIIPVNVDVDPLMHEKELKDVEMNSSSSLDEDGYSTNTGRSVSTSRRARVPF